MILRLAIFALFVGAITAAQTTIVTGTVIDSNGMAYANGTILPQLVVPGGATPTLNGNFFVPGSSTASLDGSGTFSLNVQDNSQISPAGSKWTFTICSGPGSLFPARGKGSMCFTTAAITVSGGTQSITSDITAVPPPALIANLGPTPMTAGTLNNVCIADSQAGTNAGAKIAACAALLPSTGGTINALGLQGAQTVTSNPFAGIEKPISLLTGNATYSWDATSFNWDLPHDFTLEGYGTIFLNSTTNGLMTCFGVGGASSINNCGMLNARIYSTTGSITSGTNSLTVASATGIRMGSIIGIIGAAGGDANGQTTTINQIGGIGTSDTTVTVTSSAGFAFGTNLYVLIDSEMLALTNISGNTFTITRAQLGTAAATHHNAASVTAVPALVTQVTNVSGATVTTLDNASFTVSSAPVFAGASNIRIDGDMTLDGNYHNRTLVGYPSFGISAALSANITIGPAIKFQYFGHGGSILQASRYNRVSGSYRHIGRPVSTLGSDVWVFSDSSYNVVDTTYHEDGVYEVIIDDRSTAYNIFAYGSSNNRISIGPMSPVASYPFCADIEGYSSNNLVYTTNCNASNTGLMVTGSGQWPNATPTPFNNVFHFTNINSSNPITTSLYGAATASGNIFYGGVVVAGAISLISTGDTVLTSSANGWGTFGTGSGSGTLRGNAYSFTMLRSAGALLCDICGNASRLRLGDSNGTGLGAAGATFGFPGATSGEGFLQGPSTGGVTNTLPQVAGTLTVTIASGTATMTTAAIAAGACGTTVTVPASGVLTTDAIAFSFNAAPAANAAELPISSWPSANNLNFRYCNPTAASVTPSAATLNWRVTR